MNKMKHYRRFLLLLAMLPVGTFAKDNFKMMGGTILSALSMSYYSHKNRLSNAK